MDRALIIIAPLLFLVALAYASVGLGGGTAYLSVISFCTVDKEVLRPTAWGLNVVVAVVGVVNFSRKGHLDLRLVWHYLLGGSAGVLLGKALPISDPAFRWLLATMLAALAIRMLASSGRDGGENERAARRIAWPLGLLLGFGPGVLSGLTGMGGGIVLGPIVLALRLLPVKRVAALTAAYILIVSASGLGMHFAQGGTLPWLPFGLFALLVLAGGLIGSRYGAGRARPATLRRLLAAIVLLGAVNLVLKALFTTAAAAPIP